MKKALSLILVLVLCPSLCACGGEMQMDATTAPPPESVSVHELFEDITNGAKCTLNVGKQVTVLGQIETISSDSCKVELVSNPGMKVAICLPIEELATLSAGQFVAVTGIVKAFNQKSFEKYTISAEEPLDQAAMDKIFHRIVAINFTYGLCNKAYFFKDSLHILYDYMSQRGSQYTMDNNEELKEYLCGTWDCGYYKNSLQESSFTSFDITYNEDGSAKYSIQKSWRHDWEVSDDGMLHSFFGKKRVFILSDNVFICDGYVFVRQE